MINAGVKTGIFYLHPKFILIFSLPKHTPHAIAACPNFTYRLKFSYAI